MMACMQRREVQREGRVENRGTEVWPDTSYTGALKRLHILQHFELRWLTFDKALAPPGAIKGR